LFAGGSNTVSKAIEMMEIEEDKLIDDVPVWTAEDFLKYARDCKICLFT
jgi:hypothetical protein